ncbi:hypothetical protein HN51_027745 [Arachis hypogaea]
MRRPCRCWIHITASIAKWHCSRSFASGGGGSCECELTTHRLFGYVNYSHPQDDILELHNLRCLTQDALPRFVLNYKNPFSIAVEKASGKKRKHSGIGLGAVSVEKTKVGGGKLTIRNILVIYKKERRQMANLYMCWMSSCLQLGVLEKEFWKEVACGKMETVQYACDVDAVPSHLLLISLVAKLFRLPKSAWRLLESSIPIKLIIITVGHQNDIPGHAALDFERVVREHVYILMIFCQVMEKMEPLMFSWGKTILFSPNSVLEHEIPVYKAVQKLGEFVITFAKADHVGFSHN